jgi:hypothetical protein
VPWILECQSPIWQTNGSWAWPNPSRQFSRSPSSQWWRCCRTVTFERRRHLQADDKSIFDTFLIRNFVVYLQITMDDVWCPRMKEVETFQDLTAPRLEHL